jgi:hypothetical protein
MIRTRKTVRRATRSQIVRAWRALDRAAVRALPGYRRGPGDLSQALTAFARAIRCHRRLARLAPSFFDAAVVDREAREREEQRRWMESWEPILEKVYGPAHASGRPADGVTARAPLPGPRTRRAIERELANLALWMAAGSLALARHRQRRPHALPSFTQLSRLLLIGFDFGSIACGLDTCHAAPALPSDAPDPDEALARAYGHR